MCQTVRTRFAPSPTGYMHIGNLRAALYAYLFAKHHQGTFILRIEDTDQQREVEGAVDKIYQSMQLAGLKYDEGPDVGGDFGPYIQSQRKQMYRPYADQLVDNGRAYYCFCTPERLNDLREQAEKNGGTFKYDGHCSHTSKEEARARAAAGEPFVIRLKVPTEGVSSFEDAVYGTISVENSTLDDMVLLKSDGLPTYNFANVVDDHLMGITHVMRGSEYLSSTPKYDLVYEGFGWEKPKYIHLPSIMKDATRKLSKRYGDPSFEDLLNQGFIQPAIINYIALLGWNPGTNQEMFTLEELEQAFSVEGLHKSPSIFDTAKLTWFNAEYIRKMDEAEYDSRALPILRQALPGWEDARLTVLCRLLQSRTEVFTQLPEMVDFLAATLPFGPELYDHKKMKTNAEVAAQTLPEVLKALELLPDWTQEALHDTLMALATTLGVKNGQVLWPLRVALSGKPTTPGGAIEIAFLLGREQSISRIKSAIDAF